MHRALHLARWFVLTAFVAVSIITPSGSSADELNHAGVVIRHADGSLTYAYVAFPEEQITGIELLKRTGLPVDTVSFGGLGDAICGIEKQGCVPEECSKRLCQGPKPDDPYWQYFRQNTAGEWREMALGASATKVHDGDIDGWSWTGKQAQLPALTIDDIVRLSGAADPNAVGVTVRASGAVSVESRSSWSYVAASLLLLAGGIGAFVAVRRSKRRAAA